MRHKFLRAAVPVFLLLWTWVLFVFHFAPASPPLAAPQDPAHPAQAFWMPKEEAGIHQLVLEGSPYERGSLEGEKTQALMAEQEDVLVDQLKRFVPSELMRKFLTFMALQWFWGAEKYVEDGMTQEMLGVSKWSTHRHDDLGAPYIRQLSYHAVHEIGQMMVDSGIDTGGCTVVALPWKQSWIVGRNFDFEGGLIFDSEKIIKWVFPEKGNAFVSVIWAGMVGAVTGVNDHGVYISINAAGSSDYRRLGTPSTLVLLKALQFSNTAGQAAEIIKQSTMFITDIFVVTDSQSGKFYRIEKSPEHTEIIPVERPSVISNDLASPYWEKDPTNQTRKKNLTSVQRRERGQALIDKLRPVHAAAGVNGVLSILRDKGEKEGRRLYLGNRTAIDALIATHSVIYDASRSILYVGQGPAVAGPFLGYDLRASFAQRRPVNVEELPRDPIVSDELYKATKEAFRLISEGQRAIRKNQCSIARENGRHARRLVEESAELLTLEAQVAEYCDEDAKKATALRKHALELQPPYFSQRYELEEAIKRGSSRD